MKRFSECSHVRNDKVVNVDVSVTRSLLTLFVSFLTTSVVDSLCTQIYPVTFIGSNNTTVPLSLGFDFGISLQLQQHARILMLHLFQNPNPQPDRA